MSVAKFRKQLRTKLLARLLAGNNVTCNICNHSYASFLPYLDRANALCPNCGSLERVRLVYYFIQQLQLINNNTKLLHVAPEKCLFDIFSKQLDSNYTAVDKFEDVYDYPDGTVEMDITSIPMADETMNMVICIHVLEHIQEDRKAISEIYRVLKKGGVAILQVPYDKERTDTYEDASIVSREDRRKHFGQFDHVRIYGTDFINRFTAPGFTIEHKDFAEHISKDIKDKHVFKEQTIFLLRK